MKLGATGLKEKLETDCKFSYLYVRILTEEGSFYGIKLNKT